MDIFLVIALLLFILIAAIVYYVSMESGQGSALSSWFGGKDGSAKLKALIQAQRGDVDNRLAGSSREIVMQAGREFDLPEDKMQRKETDLAKKLYYANINITPGAYYGVMAASASFLLVLVLIAVPTPMRIPFCIMAILFPILSISGVLNHKISKRVDAFDKDYVELLLTLVSLLKTGMGPLQALEAAARNLDDDAIARAETLLLMERLKMGLTEEQAIGAFGEDIDHKEIELFVQSLLLSRSAGGKLSDTLERLAKQVRKRQQFRKQARGAISMERGSMYAVSCILGFVVSFVFVTSTDLREAVLNNDGGLTALGWCLLVVSVGFIWMNNVAKIKV